MLKAGTGQSVNPMSLEAGKEACRQAIEANQTT